MSKAEEINSLESLKDFIISKDNSKSFVYFSPIPDYLKTEKCILGGENFFCLHRLDLIFISIQQLMKLVEVLH